MRLPCPVRRWKVVARGTVLRVRPDKRTDEGQGMHERSASGVAPSNVGARNATSLVFCCLLLNGLGTGCAIPEYHQPQGFSSSYYRALRAQYGIVETGHHRGTTRSATEAAAATGNVPIRSGNLLPPVLPTPGMPPGTGIDPAFQNVPGSSSGNASGNGIDPNLIPPPASGSNGDSESGSLQTPGPAGSPSGTAPAESAPTSPAPGRSTSDFFGFLWPGFRSPKPAATTSPQQNQKPFLSFSTAPAATRTSSKK